MNFIPAHRHILVEKREKINKEQDGIVLLPEGYTPILDEYTRAKVLRVAESCTVPAVPGDELIVRDAFIEEVMLDGESHYLVLESHVMGIIKNEEDH